MAAKNGPANYISTRFPPYPSDKKNQNSIMSPQYTDLSEDDQILLHYIVSDQRLQARLRSLLNCARAISVYCPQFLKELLAYVQDMEGVEHDQHPFSRLRRAQEEYKPNPPALSRKYHNDKGGVAKWRMVQLYENIEQTYGVNLGFLK